MRKTPHPALEDIQLTDVMSALADPLRLGLVVLLSDGTERAWGELDAPVSKSTLSHHLKKLRGAGLTLTRDEGLRCFVRLRADELEKRFPGLLISVLDAAKESRAYTSVGIKGAIEDETCAA